MLQPFFGSEQAAFNVMRQADCVYGRVSGKGFGDNRVQCVALYVAAKARMPRAGKQGFVKIFFRSNAEADDGNLFFPCHGQGCSQCFYAGFVRPGGILFLFVQKGKRRIFRHQARIIPKTAWGQEQSLVGITDKNFPRLAGQSCHKLYAQFKTCVFHCFAGVFRSFGGIAAFAPGEYAVRKALYAEFYKVYSRILQTFQAAWGKAVRSCGTAACNLYAFFFAEQSAGLEKIKAKAEVLFRYGGKRSAVKSYVNGLRRAFFQKNAEVFAGFPHRFPDALFSRAGLAFLGTENAAERTAGKGYEQRKNFSPLQLVVDGLDKAIHEILLNLTVLSADCVLYVCREIKLSGGNMQEKDCLFCKIIRGEIPSAKVYEDEYVYAFLDIAPSFPGHCLVVPKNHCRNILEIAPGEMEHIAKAVQKIAPAVLKAAGADGFNVIQNNGESAGQTVFHTHFHIIPRKAGDGLGLWTPGAYASMDEMAETAQKIQAEIR